MKFIAILFLMGATAVAAAASANESGREGLKLDELLPMAREQAAGIFEQDETNLWFWAMDCQYATDGFANDATNAVQWYNFTFYNPQTIERVPRPGNTHPTAMAYHIRLRPDGTLTNSSSGRTIDWDPAGK